MKFHHICIQTTKYEESIYFYNKILGFNLIKESENFHSRKYNSWLEKNQMMIEIQTEKNSQELSKFNKNTEGIVHFCIIVDDVEVEYKKLKSKGFYNFKSKNGEDIYEVEGGKLLKIFAPEGTIIEIRDTQII